MASSRNNIWSGKVRPSAVVATAERASVALIEAMAILPRLMASSANRRPARGDVEALERGLAAVKPGARTGDIGFFKIVAEGGVAAGIRRVEAVTGDNALAWVQAQEATLGAAAAASAIRPATTS